MSLESAASLDKFVFAQNRFDASGQNAYCKDIQCWHAAWTELIDYFYDGRILSLSKGRNDILNSKNVFSLAKIAESVVSRVLASMTGGINTRSRLNQIILQKSCEHIAKQNSPEQYAIRPLQQD